mgnify:CR=1 FL=1
MELAFADSLEFICIDSCPMSLLPLSEKEIYQPSNQQKHVTFAPSPIIIKNPIQDVSVLFNISTIQPISILKETNYKYSPYHNWFKKLSDIFYLLLMISALTFFEKLIKLHS